MLFPVALGAFHFNVLIGRKLCAHLIIGSRTGLEVFVTLEFKSSFQIPADKTIHSYPSGLRQIHEWRRI
jgi:hypothetical protein